jgi:hypothetical protein
MSDEDNKNEGAASEKPKKKEQVVPIDKQRLSISDFIAYDKKTRGPSNPYAAAFLSWFKTKGHVELLSDKDKDKKRNKLGIRVELKKWQELFEKCMNTEVK